MGVAGLVTPYLIEGSERAGWTRCAARTASVHCGCWR